MYSIRATYIPRDDMYFDRDYYVSKHIPLAKEQLTGRIQYIQMYAEFETRVLLSGGDNKVQAPCVYVLLVETAADVAAFEEFLSGPDVMPLRDDVKKYTNCTSIWTVAEIAT